jgi:hypothetical protein
VRCLPLGFRFHRQTRLNGQPGNASIELNPGETKYGPLKDAKSGYHETEYSELHTKAEFCGSCHNIFHSVNQFPIEHTYDEWKNSPYAQADIPCQDCHMVPVDVAIQVADRMVRAKDVPNHGLGGSPPRAPRRNARSCTTTASSAAIR